IVSNASDDFPEPDSPVNTTRAFRGSSTSMFLRLCSRAPRTMRASPGIDFEASRVMVLRSTRGLPAGGSGRGRYGYPLYRPFTAPLPPILLLTIQPFPTLSPP